MIRVYINEESDDSPLDQVITFKTKYDNMILTTDVIPAQKRFLIRHLLGEDPIASSNYLDAVISTLLVCIKKVGLIPNVNAPTAENMTKLQARLKAQFQNAKQTSAFNSKKQFDAIVSFWMTPLTDYVPMVISTPVQRLIEVL